MSDMSFSDINSFASAGDYATQLWGSFTTAVGGLWDQVVGTPTTSNTSTDTSTSSGLIGSAFSNLTSPSTANLNLPFSLNSSSDSTLLSSPASADLGTLDNSPVQNSNTTKPNNSMGDMLNFMGKNGAAALLLGGMKMIGDSANLNQQKKIADATLAQNQQKIDLEKQQQQFTQKNSFVPTINVNPVTPNVSPFLPGGKTYNPVTVNTGIVGSGMQL